MSSWVVAVEADEIVDGEVYFVGKRPVSRLAEWLFYSELKNGNRQFSVKPGIALEYAGSDELRKFFRENPDLCAVKVPADAKKRWRARR